MKSHSLKNTDNTKTTHAFFAASLILFMSILIIVSGFLNRNPVQIKSSKSTFEVFDSRVMNGAKKNPNSNSNTFLYFTNDFTNKNEKQVVEEENLFESNKFETAQADLLFGNKSVYELDAFEMEIFTFELLADLFDETESALTIESIDLTIESPDFAVEPNPFLEQLAEAKNRELADFYKNYYMLNDFLQPIEEKELQLEEWMLDENLWTAK